MLTVCAGLAAVRLSHNRIIIVVDVVAVDPVPQERFCVSCLGAAATKRGFMQTILINFTPPAASQRASDAIGGLLAGDRASGRMELKVDCVACAGVVRYFVTKL